MQTTKEILKNLIPATLGRTKPAPITRPWLNVKWSNAWLRGLRTSHHPKLKELESEVGWFCFDMWKDPLNGRLLVLTGKNGTGKTHCARAVNNWVSKVGHAKEFVERQNHISHLTARFWHWPALLDHFKEGGWDTLEDLFSVPCLILDELGGGYDPSKVGADKLCQVLSRRERKWTLCTMNTTPDYWESEFDRRIASRLLRNSTIIDLSDVPDFASI